MCYLRLNIDMEVYIAKDRKRATTDITATHATVKQMTRIEKGHDHKSHMDNYFLLLTYIMI